MQAIFNRTLRPIVLAGLILLSACDSSLDAGADVELSAQELAMTSEIVSQALSDQQEGTMSDFNDMSAGVSASGLVYGEGHMNRFGGNLGASLAGRMWRGGDRFTLVRYDSATGEHTLQYERLLDRPNVEKRLDARLTYVFQGEQGEFLAFPRRDLDEVAAITFEGHRSGSTTIRRGNAGERHSDFSRQASWQVSGLLGNTATFNGSQSDEGSFRMETDSGRVERSYRLTLESRNVTLTRANTAEGIEGAVTGQLAYEVTLERTRNGGSVEKTVTGVIELEGNGQALLRFLGTGQLYRLDLRTGAVARAEG